MAVAALKLADNPMLRRSDDLKRVLIELAATLLRVVVEDLQILAPAAFKVVCVVDS